MKMPFMLILSSIFGIIILGVISLHADVVVLSIPLVAYLFAAILRRPEEIKLSVTREIYPEYVPEGMPVTVKVTVLNQGASIDELVIEDILPKGIQQIDGTSSRIALLEAGSKMEFEYTIEAQRGDYKGYEVLVKASDFLQLFELALIYRTSTHLIVYPPYTKLDRIKIRPPQTHGFAGPIPARQGGVGIDFWGVREYQTGDSQRQINWKLAARSNQELYVNVFEQERVASVGLIVDARLRTNLVSQSGSLFEYSVRAAASVAENFLNDGNRVSLLIYGSEMSRVFSGYGKSQRDRILRALANANPGVNYALESLMHLPTQIFPAKSQIILISSLLPEDIAIILRMRSQGYAVMVISPDPVAYEATTSQEANDLAYRMANAERSFILQQLRENGVQTVNWRVDQPLELAIRETVSHQPAIAFNHMVKM
jgi:uncharacterized protein (DUF58 family)